MKLGEKIRVFRNLKGYSQEVMADGLGISTAGYGKIERNETEVTVTRLDQIASLLQVRTEDILSFDEKVSFHNYAGSQAQNLIQNQNYTNFIEIAEYFKKIYETRIQTLEDELMTLKNRLK